MSLTQLIAETIDTRSFPSLWYWVVVIVIWSRASYVTLGVPLDMIDAARQEDFEGPSAERLVDLARIGVLRRLRWLPWVPWLVFFWAFGLTCLLVLGFGYGMQLAQALALIAVPMSVILILSLAAAKQIRSEDPEVDRLVALLQAHRRRVLVISAIALFVTALWGMFVNLSLPAWY